MFEELTTNAGQTLVAIFWIILALILIWGLTLSRTEIKARRS